MESHYFAEEEFPSILFKSKYSIDETLHLTLTCL